MNHKIEELETEVLTDGDTIVMVGCGAVQFIGVVQTGVLDALQTKDPLTLANAGVIIVNRAVAEAAPGCLKILKQTFIASMSMGGGPQKITVKTIDFYQIPAADMEEEDYVAVLEEYKRFVDTNDTSQEIFDEPRIVDPRVATEVARTLMRRGMPKS